MKLSSSLAGFFSKSIRERGSSYFYRRAVTIEYGTDREVGAVVEGSSSYDVMISCEGDKLVVDCTCPFMNPSYKPCKHIWATILAAEKEGHLKQVATKGYLSLVTASFVDQEDLDDDAEDEIWEEPPMPAKFVRLQKPGSSKSQPLVAKEKPPAWKAQLSNLQHAMSPSYSEPSQLWPVGKQLLYVVDVPATKNQGELILEVLYRERKMNGEWSRPKGQGISAKLVPKLPDAIDREILVALQGATHEWDSGYGYGSGASGSRFRLPHLLQSALLPKICHSGRCFLRLAPPALEPAPLEWDDGSVWEFWLEGTPDPRRDGQLLVRGSLRRGEERRDLSEPRLLLAGGLVFGATQVARLEDFGAFAWIGTLRQIGSIAIPLSQKEQFLQELFQLPHLPRLDFPGALTIEEISVEPQPHLRVRAPQNEHWSHAQLRAILQFSYEGAMVPCHHPGRGVFHPQRGCLMLRNFDFEQAALESLRQHGFRQYGSYYDSRSELELAPKKLPGAVRALVNAGWHVEADGKLYRQPGNLNLAVTSGIDWFELNGEMQFGDQVVRLPSLLAALKRGESMVRLDDGTFGLLPEEWLKRFGTLASVGSPQKDHVQFSRAQVGFLDALLAAMPETSFDEVFANARNELQRFNGIAPADAPNGFTGALRGYQREGVGWLHFLRQFGFGGCLADDMGLGKTIQVLALLESRRDNTSKPKSSGSRNGGDRPSLVVAPRSLVFNWKQEAARFTPELRVLDHTGSGRTTGDGSFDGYDLVITTYGTLRRDAAHLKNLLFDYVILDEAQAIKNASTESAKAARLLRGKHRLALSGTPIENHLGELWSLFEFLNPGLLGTASVFQLAGIGKQSPDTETRLLLSKALKPFILRRTKSQVAKDLPEKFEQTLYCELEAEQRKLYNELRDYYRESLLGRIEQQGIQKAKILVLEALLRLRQAACHPGLIDKSKRLGSSAKLDLLLPQLNQVIDEGHKALVFSQFTSLLSIVRERLDQEHVPYEYLDGKTRDRARRVERFQTDSECKLFLISLKAGGLGLNLTAAEYVYLLDSWWNPAVEAQAIDRSHRIGQSRQVFAYRLIARNTVEEKVLELQKGKRELADALLNEDNSFIRNLQREDLELLFG